MGDDADYYIEQQEDEARFKQACEYAERDRNTKSLLCWTDGYVMEIWSWEPLSKIPTVFSNLKLMRQIGSDCFLARGIPIEDEDWDDEYANPTEIVNPSEIKLINELEFYVANSEVEATHEVIVLSRHDATLLKEEADRQKNSAKTLKEEMIAEMMEEMVSFIESEAQGNIFVFAREI